MMENFIFPYDEMRPAQKQFFDCINDEGIDKKYIIAEMPTGIGKSAIGVASILNNKDGFIITSSKALQDQYERDYSKYSLTSLMGKANYTCWKYPSYNCENSFCRKKSSIMSGCIKTGSCPYINQRKKASNSKIFLTNYAFFLGGGIEKPRDVLVIDEAHLLEDALISASKVELNTNELNSKFGLEYYLSNEELDYLHETPDALGLTLKNEKYINIIYKGLIKRKDEIIEKEDTGDREEEDNQEYDQDLDLLLEKLENFKTNAAEFWIVEYKDVKKTLYITPLRVDWIFKRLIDKWAIKKIIFMSATILDFDLYEKTFGLEKSNCYELKMESDFDPKNSPIYNIGNCKTSYKDLKIEANLNKICDDIKIILESYKNDKGIIHTGNFKISKYIKDHINDKRLLVRYDSDTNQDILNRHIKSSEPTVLVSSSLTEGIDLKDDLSRFQIIVKLPFFSLADPRVKKMSETLENWYIVQMWMKLIQASGRSTRSENDFCKTYILDNSFGYRFAEATKKGYLNKYFIERVIDL